MPSLSKVRSYFMHEVQVVLDDFQDWGWMNPEPASDDTVERIRSAETAAEILRIIDNETAYDGVWGPAPDEWGEMLDSLVSQARVEYADYIIDNGGFDGERDCDNSESLHDWLAGSDNFTGTQEDLDAALREWLE